MGSTLEETTRIRDTFAGRFVIDARIGSGAFGEVFRGSYNDRPAVIKVLNPPEHVNGTDFSSIVSEVSYLERANSPNVVEVYEAGMHEGKYFIIMEDGGDPLSTLKAGEIGLEKTVDIYLQAATGLRDLNRQGLHHRDIKPDNLLIDKTGTVKFTDLGMSYKRTKKNSHAIKKAFGTPLWAAPEQFDGKHITASDVYSLGLVMYKLLTGELPFTPGIRSQVQLHEEKLRKHESIRSKFPSLPKDLAHIIDESISPVSETRPSSEMLHYYLTFFKEGQPLNTMLNEDLFHNPETKVDYRLVSRWKPIDSILPSETAPEREEAAAFSSHITERTSMLLLPKRRDDCHIAIPNRGAKKRIAAHIRFLDEENTGAVTFTIASADYVRPTPELVRFGDLFIIKKNAPGEGLMIHKKYGRTLDRQSFVFGKESLEVIIERFPTRVAFSVNDNLLIENNIYTSPSSRNEVWLSATTPVAIDDFATFYEVGGALQSPMFAVERSFSEGDFSTAARLAADICYDGLFDQSTVLAARMYYAKSKAREMVSADEESQDIEGVLQVLGDIEKSAPQEITLEAGKEIANVHFFVGKDYQKAVDKLNSMLEIAGDNKHERAKIVARAMRFASSCNDGTYRRIFRDFRKTS